MLLTRILRLSYPRERVVGSSAADRNGVFALGGASPIGFVCGTVYRCSIEHMLLLWVVVPLFQRQAVRFHCLDDI